MSTLHGFFMSASHHFNDILQMMCANTFIHFCENPQREFQRDMNSITLQTHCPRSGFPYYSLNLVPSKIRRQYNMIKNIHTNDIPLAWIFILRLISLAFITHIHIISCYVSYCRGWQNINRSLAVRKTTFVVFLIREAKEIIIELSFFFFNKERQCIELSSY